VLVKQALKAGHRSAGMIAAFVYYAAHNPAAEAARMLTLHLPAQFSSEHNAWE
jgi:hypothetical protein